MTKRLIELDDDLLDRARSALGTSTITATVREALEVASSGDPGEQYIQLLASLPGLSPDLRDDAWRTGRR